MSKLFNGSICLSELNEAAKKGHSAFSKSEKNGKIYVNLTMWENDNPDKYDNTVSLQLNPKKDSGDDKSYIGNFKPVQYQQNTVAPQARDIPDDDDLPF